MEAYICQICKEPIGNFVCIECLAEDIRCWLPSPLSPAFQRFTAELLVIFSYPHLEIGHHIDHRGLVCGSKGRGSVCLYCYLNEVYQWMKGEDEHMAEQFVKLFNFGLKPAFQDILLARPVPIDPADTLAMEGFCEECEGMGEVKYINGAWVCEECREQHGGYQGMVS